MKKMFPKYKRNIIASTGKTALAIASELYSKGYTNLVMVVGSDRVQDFKKLLDRYNGEKKAHGFYDFDKIEVVSAGERDPDAEGVEGMSASKMRAAAQQNDLNSFAKGLPSGYNPTDLFNAVRKGMGLKKESTRQYIELPTVSETREEYIEGGLFSEGDHVKIKDSGDYGKIVFCGSNYVMVESNDVRKRYWLDAVEKLSEYNELGSTKTLKKYLKDTPYMTKVEAGIGIRKEREDPDTVSYTHLTLPTKRIV